MRQRFHPLLISWSACWTIGMRTRCTRTSCSIWRSACLTPLSSISSGPRLSISFHASNGFLASTESMRISSLCWSKLRSFTSAASWCVTQPSSISNHRKSVRPLSSWPWTQAYTSRSPRCPTPLSPNISVRQKWRPCFRIKQLRSELTDSSLNLKI